MTDNVTLEIYGPATIPAVWSYHNEMWSNQNPEDLMGITTCKQQGKKALELELRTFNFKSLTGGKNGNG